MNSVEIIEPQTKEQFEAYYLLRYEVLRKPWGQIPGSEKDDQENECIHIMAVSNNECVGVCRLQFNSGTEAQLRYMGVSEKAQGMGIGKQLITFAEEKARQKKAENMILHARENAVKFYIACGYTIREKSYLMWGTIQHFLMEKNL
jgi:predicted GNAT family N-acyltransferase